MEVTLKIIQDKRRVQIMVFLYLRLGIISLLLSERTSFGVAIYYRISIHALH
jgi:hypothetical protein